MQKKLKSQLLQKISKYVNAFKLKKAKHLSDSSVIQSPLMTSEEVAEYLRISKATVYSKRCRGEFPEGCAVKIFGKRMFLREKIEQLVEDSIEPSFGHS